MIYRLFTKSREYLLTGSPGLDLKAAYKRFLTALSRDRRERHEQLKGVLKALAPDQEPEAEDLEAQVFVAVAQENLDLRLREMTEVNLMTDSIQALLS